MALFATAISVFVSTRSRPKAAELTSRQPRCFPIVSTRSRPKAADYDPPSLEQFVGVSTRSRPKAAEAVSPRLPPFGTCFNTQPPEGG